MSTDCLLLDQSYQPIGRVDWQAAVTHLFTDEVEVVETHDAAVRSVTLEVKLPAVLRFVRRVTSRKRQVKFSRENVWARDKGRCQYCGQVVHRDDFTYDHVVPRAQGGHTTWTNVVVACGPCNQKKGGRTPQQAAMSLRAEPVKPSKLPDAMRFCLTWSPGMPPAWKAWLRDISYWHGALEQD